MKDTKRLCKWKTEDITDHLDVYRELVRKPKYVCMKCGRVSGKKKNVCKHRTLK